MGEGGGQRGECDFMLVLRPCGRKNDIFEELIEGHCG